MTCLLLPTLAARAGSYSAPAYSGGQVTFTDSTASSPPPPLPYSPSSSPDQVTGAYTYGGGAGNSCSPDRQGHSTSYSITAAGAITATFTWQPASPGELAPQNVIVVEHGVANWGGGMFGTGVATGACDSGLGQSSASGSVSATCNVTQYRVKSPAVGGSVTVTCTPGASISGVSGAMGMARGGAGVTYSAQFYPVTINLVGTTKDSSGGDNILVGQGCTASISGIPSDLLNNTANPPTYVWSVSNNTFQSWTVNIDNAGNPSSTTFVGGPGPLTNPTAHWYWSDVAGNQTVTCTATVTPPAGQGSTFTVTATKTVNLVVPVTTERATVGRVQINNLSQQTYGSGYSLYAGGNDSQNYGIIYATQVQTPAPFSPGIWNMVQLVTPGSWYTVSGQSETANPGNGVQVLDTRYPFYPSSNPSYPTGVPADNLTAQPFDGPAIAGLLKTVIRYRVSDNFSTYVMFLPPGSDTQWVPLWDIGWNWNADVSIPGTTWASWDNATDAGIVRVGSTASTITHPQWNNIIH